MTTTTTDLAARGNAGGVTNRPAGDGDDAGSTRAPRDPSAPLSHGALPAPSDPGDSPVHNRVLFEKVAARIEESPDRYRQSDWYTETDCGTAYCVAGWAITLAHGEEWWDYVSPDVEGLRAIMDEAQRLLGIGEVDADWLFAPDWRPVNRETTVPDALRAV